MKRNKDDETQRERERERERENNYKKTVKEKGWKEIKTMKPRERERERERERKERRKYKLLIMADKNNLTHPQDSSIRKCSERIFE